MAIRAVSVSDGARLRAGYRPGTGRVRHWEPGIALRLVLAIVSAVLNWLAFPPYGWWPLAVLAVAGIVLAVRQARLRTAFAVGLVHAAVFYLLLLGWLRTVGVDAWAILAAAEAVITAIAIVAVALVQRLPGWPVWVASALVAGEAVRARAPLGGFTWGRLAFSQADSPLVHWAAVGGAPLVSFAVAVLGALLAWLLLSRTRPRRIIAVLVGAGVVVGGAYAVPVPVHGESAGGPSYAIVGVVQGNVPRLGLDAFAQRAAVTRNHVAATLQLVANVVAGKDPHPQAVIWPENSTDVDPFQNADVGNAIDLAVRAVDVPTLVGAVVGVDATHVRNTGIVWDPVTGPGASYDKRHLVPFGEYVPYRAELGGVFGELRRVPYDFRPGQRVGVLQLGPMRIGDVICFEIAYDGLVRDNVVHGARALVVQTNDATYGRGESVQQLAMARLRAVEHGRSVLVAATSGVSAVIAPDGSLVAHTKVFRQQVLVDRVALRDSRTIADRVGAAPEAAIAAVGALATLVALVGYAAGGGADSPARSRRAARQPRRHRR